MAKVETTYRVVLENYIAAKGTASKPDLTTEGKKAMTAAKSFGVEVVDLAIAKGKITEDEGTAIKSYLENGGAAEKTDEVYDALKELQNDLESKKAMIDQIKAEMKELQTLYRKVNGKGSSGGVRAAAGKIEHRCTCPICGVEMESTTANNAVVNTRMHIMREHLGITGKEYRNADRTEKGVMQKKVDDLLEGHKLVAEHI